MELTDQIISQINALVTSAQAAGASFADVVLQFQRAQQNATVQAELAKPCPVPSMALADVAAIIQYVNDGGGTPNVQDVYSRLKDAIAAKDQPTFWRLLFLLIKSLMQQNPAW